MNTRSELERQIRMTVDELENLTTEQPNPRSEAVDKLDTESILLLIHEEDSTVPEAVGRVIPDIVKVVEAAVRAINSGGRLIYVGAGTSGRLGVLDAAECPPTFGADPEWVVGVIAGGDTALRYAREGAEDDTEQAVRDLEELAVGEKDAVLGISARGTTPYVRKFIEAAKKQRAWTGLISCNPVLKKNGLDTVVEINVGPEIITGSTRMKAGLATRMVLTMITTTAMIRLGRVKGNRMVDLMPNSVKLRARSVKIIMESLGVDFETALKHLEMADGNLRRALTAGAL